MSEEENLVKKLLHLTEGAKAKPSKDLFTAILTRMNRGRSQDIYVEYFECLEDMRQIKAGIQINLKNNAIKKEDKELEEKILNNINVACEDQLATPKAEIDSSCKKYLFGLGGSAQFEDYEKFKKTIQETNLINKITKMSNLCSDGLAFLGIEKPEFWFRDDGVEEIDITKETNEPKKPITSSVLLK